MVDGKELRLRRRCQESDTFHLPSTICHVLAKPIVRALSREVRVVVRIVVNHRAPTLAHQLDILAALLARADAGRLVVEELRVWREDNAEPRFADTEAEVDVIEVDRQRLVKTADIAELLAPCHQAGGGDG